MESKLQKKLTDIALSLSGSKVELLPSLKLLTAELILRLMASRKKSFGLFVILGWDDKWNDFLDIPDSQQDIFAKHHIDITKILAGKSKKRDVSMTVDFDGAILIDHAGLIVHSGVIIEGLRPRVVAEKLNPGTFKDLSEQLGFDTKVHARHLSAIAASHVFRGTTVFTVSEENDSFHLFEDGRIIHHIPAA